MTPADFASLLSRAAADLPLQIQLAEAETIHEAQRSAVRHSSGPHSLLALAAMGHPYAKRHGAPQLDPGEINIQRRDKSGAATPEAFASGWETELPQPVGGGFVGSLFNTSDIGPLLQQGTASMFARPVDQKVAQDVEPGRLRRLDDAFDVAMR